MIGYKGKLNQEMIGETYDPRSPAKMREKLHHQKVMKRRRKRRATYQGTPPEYVPPPPGPPGDE